MINPVRESAESLLVFLALGTAAFFGPAGLSSAQSAPGQYPVTPRSAVVDTLHGVPVEDPYRWLEDSKDPKVARWDAVQDSLSRVYLGALPQRGPFLKRLQQLSRFDDESAPRPVLDGTAVFHSAKKKDQEKWVLYYRESPEAAAQPLLDPNLWPAEETVQGTYPSRDGKYLAFGTAKGGDEHPVVQVMDVATRRILADSLLGWDQGGVSWLPDNSGFFYTANPKKGEVPPGEEHYWTSAYFHRLGEPASRDRKVFFSDTEKEVFHYAGVTEDGRYVLYVRGRYYKNEVYFAKIESPGALQPLVTGFQARYAVDEIDGTFFVRTDEGAPLGKVYTVPVDHPVRANWKEWLPEDPKDNLSYIAPIGGRIYAVYEHDAHTRIRLLDREGRYLRDLPFPALGSGSVQGHWDKPDVWVHFSSFTYPEGIYRYHFDEDRLETYWRYPVEIDLGNYVTEQVWFVSTDSTRVPMFLVRRADLQRNGANPVLLTGYGGFTVSMNPYFSPWICSWLEAGGTYALPNLRGGGEYGEDWHKGGMLGRKQQVFDDFIAAAEYLIREGYTSPEHLGIWGGSNGGLLVGAVTVQRPELFRTVVCAVPLLDMLRYHKFGYSNVWSEEYGSAEDPDQFRYLLAYSPYHQVKPTDRYPSILLTAGENDSRVDPLHARKMTARLQEVNPNGRPILYALNRSSGHIGGTTQSVQLEQRADEIAFIMHELGLGAPAW